MRSRFVFFLPLLAFAPACGAILGTDEDETADRKHPDAALEGSIDGAVAEGAAGMTDGNSVEDADGDAAVDAPLVLVPDKLVFVTENFYVGAFTNGIAGADAQCKIAAMLSNHPNITGHKGSYKAYLAPQSGGTAADRFTVDHQWNLLDGALIFTMSPKNQTLPMGPIAITERGSNVAAATAKFVWTGMTTGTEGGALRTCADWTSSANTVFGGFGDMQDWKTNGWQKNGPTAGCNETYRLYCFED